MRTDNRKLPMDLDVLRPKKSPYELIRIGGTSDGAYLLPNDLAGVSACFPQG